MSDWNLFAACLSVAAFAGAVAGYLVRDIEGFEPALDIHSGHGDVDRRSRRVDDYEPTETGVQPDRPWPRSRSAA